MHSMAPKVSGEGRRTALVAGVGIALWLYSTLSDLVSHNFLQQFFEVWNVTGFIDLQSRLVQHFFLLPLLIGALHVALRVYRRTMSMVAKWASYISCALVYGLSIRPLELFAIFLVHGRYDFFDQDNGDLWYLLTSPLYIRYGNVMGNAAICMLGMLLILSLSGQLALAEERLRLERLSSELLAVKLKTLRWQLNPHFVFNSLNTVSALLKSAPTKADRVLMKFSELLRMTLREQEQVYVGVSSELEYVHCYLNLETIRFEDRLKLSLEADEEALGATMPSLLLQPLIENAIKHGVSRIPGPALISINVSREGERLVLGVRNSSRRLPFPEPARPGGLGLRNTQERLATLYKDAFTFTYGYADNDDWNAVIEIPFQKGESGKQPPVRGMRRKARIPAEVRR